jgi:NAD(P)-dependent dehydrogenase (short-subunit alcohol dehydrogenase family)
LIPRLLQARRETPSFKPRVVTVSSSAHKIGKIRWEDIDYRKHPEEYSKWTAYGSAKLANILFAKELAKKFADEGILSYSLHPGGR